MRDRRKKECIEKFLSCFKCSTNFSTWSELKRCCGIQPHQRFLCNPPYCNTRPHICTAPGYCSCPKVEAGIPNEAQAKTGTLANFVIHGPDRSQEKTRLRTKWTDILESKDKNTIIDRLLVVESKFLELLKGIDRPEMYPTNLIEYLQVLFRSPLADVALSLALQTNLPPNSADSFRDFDQFLSNLKKSTEDVFQVLGVTI